MSSFDASLLIKLFEEQYLMQVTKLTNMKNDHVFLVETEREKYVLKTYEDEEILRWQEKFTEQVIERGTKGMIPFIKNIRNTSINRIPSHQKVFGIMPFIPGEIIDPSNWKQVKDCIKLLAHFHLKSGGIYGKKQVIPFRSQLLEKWNQRLQLFVRSLQPFHKAHEHTGVESMGGIRQAMARYYEEAIHWAKWTLTHVPKAYLLFLEEQAQWERQMAHLDVAPHNFLTMKGQYYYLLDYDLADYAPPLLDVVQFINRVSNEFEWSFDTVQELIYTYSSIYSLHPMEKKIIPLLLVYPNDLFREWLGLWKNHGGFHPERVRNYMLSLDQNWEKRRKFVQTCMNRNI